MFLLRLYLLIGKVDALLLSAYRYLMVAMSRIAGFSKT